MEGIKDQVGAKIKKNSEMILQAGLQGIPSSSPSFDLGKVDYVPDHIGIRITKIAGGIVSLAIDELIPLLSVEIEKNVRAKIRNEI